ncbi:DUF2845 domain-containing protein [Pseudomonas sp. RIT-PI-AD]|uniref:DUF2845 domain-containing protein n=1 Tax=Pseudomonas sp. RIT-PI-AD TaxID=3035294 RepID=UPI0021D9FBA3|nr:DUF2845 domain-containing protein [Pseudomonas sp. RIT-PI-AD]
MKAVLPLALPLLLLALPAQASSTMRCGSKLVSVDTPSVEVLAKCGEPSSRQALGFRQVVDRYGMINDIAVEEWVYGPQRGGMYYYLRFEGDRLFSVDSKRAN